jgi:hypothetical protein
VEYWWNAVCSTVFWGLGGTWVGVPRSGMVVQASHFFSDKILSIKGSYYKYVAGYTISTEHYLDDLLQVVRIERALDAKKVFTYVLLSSV